MRNLEKYVFFILLFAIPLQLGKHFWPNFSYVYGFRLDYVSPTLYITDLLILILFALNFRKFKKISLPDCKWQLILSFLLILGVAFSSSPAAGLYGLLKIGEMYFFGWCTYKNFGKFSSTTISKLFSISIFIQVVLASLQVYLQRSLGSIFYILGERTFSAQTPGIANAYINGQMTLRPYGTFPHPNVLAGYLVVVMTYILFNNKSKVSKFGLVVGTIGLLLTLSRISLLVWILVITWKVIRETRKNLFRKACVLTAAVLFVILFTPVGARVLSTNFGDISVRERLFLNTYALKIFEKSPVFGVGWNNFYIEVAKIWQPKDFGLTFYLQPVHNIYLLILSQTGIIFTSLAGYLLFRAILKAFNSKRLYIFPMLLSLVFMGFSDHYFLTVQQGQLLSAFVLGLSFLS